MYRLCVIFVGVVVFAGLVVPAHADDTDERDFGTRQWRGQAQVASRIVLPGDPLHPADAQGRRRFSVVRG